MKSMHKGLVVSSLVAAAAALTVWSAAAGRREQAAPVEQAPSPVESAPAAELAAAAVKVDVVAPETAPPAVSEGEPVEAPADLKITVQSTKQGRLLKVQRYGHVLALRRGGSVHVGMHEVIVPAASAAEDLVWEATSPKTLETLRGRATAPADGKATFGNTVRMATVTDEVMPSHRCVGHADGAGGFAVLCRVDGMAAAASVDGDDPKRGVWSLAGEKTLVRLDLPMTGDGASSKVMGYEKAGKGVLVRVEASRAPGELAAVLAVGSDSRVQPRVVRNIGCFCRLPPGDDRF